MENLTYMQQAKKILERSAKNKMNISDRRDLSVELAACLLKESQGRSDFAEKSRQKELSKMMDDPKGKVFTMSITDQCFRTNDSYRIADQVNFLIERYGIPKYFSFFKQMQLAFFKAFGKVFSKVFVPLLKSTLHKECSQFIMPAEEAILLKSISEKQKLKVNINLNHLGEAILGEEEALKRLNTYLEDLKKPEIKYISVKVSTLYSQINLLAWDHTISVLCERVKILLRAAKENYYLKNGTREPKFINLDMEEYKDLHLTVEVFKKVLSDEEFKNSKMGIVLQSYLPDSYMIQQDLTDWAIKRVKNGGAAIKIRIVKGANLAMEKVDAALHEWPQAPYLSKTEVDANFKRMMNYAFRKNNAQAVHIGIGSHNLLDICYGLILRAENNVEECVSFEMLDGMAPSLRDVVQEISGSMLVYCPAAAKHEFQNAVAYLVRRLDENTGEENFLRDLFDLQVGSKKWLSQVQMFKKACDRIGSISDMPRRHQNRFNSQEVSACRCFENEADTDFSLHQNALWADAIISEWSRKKDIVIPNVVGDETHYPSVNRAEGTNPNDPEKTIYSYALAGNDLIEKAIASATHEQLNFKNTSFETRADYLKKVADILRNNRRELIGVMCLDTAKTVFEADVEISEAIDFAEYYSRQLMEFKNFSDLKFSPRGVTLVAPPWNFPCSIPAGGILAAIATGNCVIFKPAPEAVYVGWVLVQIFWQAGISQSVLQFINCEDEPYGTTLIKDPRIKTVVLTGSTETAKLFLKFRPDIHLIAETGGKNAIIVSNLSDRDQAVKDIVQSAFGHAGQKCSACSLVVCLKEVYDDPDFKKQLKDAASSWIFGSSMNLKTRLNPLIKPPSGFLLKAIEHLEEHEEWLLEPKQDKNNPCLYTPGIKWGVLPNSFMHLEELFGPVLSVMKADDLASAIKIVNATRYGLTSGLQSLDVREQNEWLEKIQAGNCYINRGITGAIVQRQPFGGWKESSYSPGAKAGGPNYLMQFMHIEQKDLPIEFEKHDAFLLDIERLVPQEDKLLWQSSIGSYTFFFNQYFSLENDVSQVLGEDNILRYLPRKDVEIRIDEDVSVIDVLRVLACARIVNASVKISTPKAFCFGFSEINIEDEDSFVERIKNQSVKRVRFLKSPSQTLTKKLVDHSIYIIHQAVLANGRIELLNYLKEQSITNAYHRYGNLGERDLC